MKDNGEIKKAAKVVIAKNRQNKKLTAAVAAISNDKQNAADQQRMECRNESLVGKDATLSGAVMTIQSISENICDSNSNNNRIAVESIKELQVADKTEERVIAGDIESIDSRANGKYGICRTETLAQRISCNSNVNENGNGENDCDTVSKSTDPRRRATKKLIIVPNANSSNNCSNPSISFGLSNPSNCDFVQSDSNGRSESDEQGQSSQQQRREFSQRRVARDLEQFINDSGKSGSDSHRSRRAIRNSDRFNNNNFNEKVYVDWVFVAIRIQRSKSCDSFFDKQQNNRFSEPLPTTQYYTTSEFSVRENKKIITFYEYPSTTTLNQETAEYNYRVEEHLNCEQDYGIFHSHNRTVRRLLWFIKFLDFNIKTGTPIGDSIFDATTSTPKRHTMRYTYSRNLAALRPLRHFLSSNEICSDFNYHLQEPCSSGKDSELFSRPMIHSNSTLTSMSSIDSSPKSSKSSSVKCVHDGDVAKSFGLTEDGDIILNIDHIDEEKGFGFMMRRKKQVYRNVVYGEEVFEHDPITIAGVLKRFFKGIAGSLCKCCRGEFYPHRCEFFSWTDSR